jgi:hypothetical protein
MNQHMYGYDTSCPFLASCMPSSTKRGHYMALFSRCNGLYNGHERYQLHLCLLLLLIYHVYDPMWHGVGRGAGNTARVTSEDPWHQSSGVPQHYTSPTFCTFMTLRHFTMLLSSRFIFYLSP